MGIIHRIKRIVFVDFRIFKYKMLSECKRVKGNATIFHPLLLKGKGQIEFGKNVQIGVVSSPNYFSHYSYIEAREIESKVIIGNNVAINNAFSIVAFSTIIIEDDVLIGVNCSIIDNDGHHLDADKRNTGIPKSAPVTIKDNAFLGSNVTVLKGVTIGKNSVIGNGSVVTRSIPDNVIAAGNPAQVIRNL